MDLPTETFAEDGADLDGGAEPAPAGAAPAIAIDPPWDADPADLADQLAEVPLDDDRY